MLQIPSEITIQKVSYAWRKPAQISSVNNSPVRRKHSWKDMGDHVKKYSTQPSNFVEFAEPFPSSSEPSSNIQQAMKAIDFSSPTEMAGVAREARYTIFSSFPGS